MATNYVQITPATSIISARLPKPVPSKLNRFINGILHTSETSFRLPSPPSSSRNQSNSGIGFYWR